MKLSELDPHWLVHENKRVGLTFQCPHCRETYLSCFSEKFPLFGPEDGMGQYRLIKAAIGEDKGKDAVGCNKNNAWQIGGNFDNLTVTPSVDASASGHWHGFITNGELV